MLNKFHAITLIYCLWASTKAMIDICSKRTRTTWIRRDVYWIVNTQYVCTIYFFDGMGMVAIPNEKQVMNTHFVCRISFGIKIHAITSVLCLWASRKTNINIFANKRNKINNNKYTMWSKQGIDSIVKKYSNQPEYELQNTIHYHLLLLWCNSYNTKYSFFKLKNS